MSLCRFAWRMMRCAKFWCPILIETWSLKCNFKRKERNFSLQSSYKFAWSYWCGCHTRVLTIYIERSHLLILLKKNKTLLIMTNKLFKFVKKVFFFYCCSTNNFEINKDLLKIWVFEKGLHRVFFIHQYTARPLSSFSNANSFVFKWLIAETKLYLKSSSRPVIIIVTF